MMLCTVYRNTYFITLLLQYDLSALHFIPIALLTIKICFALSLIIFPVSYWFKVLLCPFSSSGRSRSKCNWRVACVALSAHDAHFMKQFLHMQQEKATNVS
jgi:hypothetical protein